MTSLRDFLAALRDFLTALRGLAAALREFLTALRDLATALRDFVAAPCFSARWPPSYTMYNVFRVYNKSFPKRCHFGSNVMIDIFRFNPLNVYGT